VRPGHRRREQREDADRERQVEPVGAAATQRERPPPHGQQGGQPDPREQRGPVGQPGVGEQPRQRRVRRGAGAAHATGVPERRGPVGPGGGWGEQHPEQGQLQGRPHRVCRAAHPVRPEAEGGEVGQRGDLHRRADPRPRRGAGRLCGDRRDGSRPDERAHLAEGHRVVDRVGHREDGRPQAQRREGRTRRDEPGPPPTEGRPGHRDEQHPEHPCHGLVQQRPGHEGQQRHGRVGEAEPPRRGPAVRRARRPPGVDRLAVDGQVVAVAPGRAEGHPRQVERGHHRERQRHRQPRPDGATTMRAGPPAYPPHALEPNGPRAARGTGDGGPGPLRTLVQRRRR